MGHTLRKVEYKETSTGDIHTGSFHQWGTDLYEMSESTCQYTIAIVEKTDGSIIKINPEFIKFIS